MAHCIVPEAEAILDKEYPVLDKGFIRLVDYLGGDARIVQAARVSYGEGTKTVRQDGALIDYLLRHEHTSPFEQVILTFHVKLPVFVARQWIRHRTARLNEISGRYSVMKNEFYLPAAEDCCEQSTDNKQGRSDIPYEKDKAEHIIQSFAAGQKKAYEDYMVFIESGTARELSRINLPLSLYTEWYWQIDLHNLFHFLKLRLDNHAQKEIRLYAETMLNIAGKVAPLAVDSFSQNIKDGVRFSKTEMIALKSLLAGNKPEITGKELERFEEKLQTGTQL